MELRIRSSPPTPVPDPAGEPRGTVAAGWWLIPCQSVEMSRGNLPAQSSKLVLQGSELPLKLHRLRQRADRPADRPIPGKELLRHRPELGTSPPATSSRSPQAARRTGPLVRGARPPRTSAGASAQPQNCPDPTFGQLGALERTEIQAWVLMSICGRPVDEPGGVNACFRILQAGTNAADSRLR
jgi:hypothetical protein